MERLRGDRKQLSVAQRAGINRSSWSSYEAGRRMPNPETYSKIAHGLDCTEAELDRAVQRQWQERLREEGTGEGREPTPLPTETDEAHRILGLSGPEALTLASASERIQEVVQTLLKRHN